MVVAVDAQVGQAAFVEGDAVSAEAIFAAADGHVEDGLVFLDLVAAVDFFCGLQAHAEDDPSVGGLQGFAVEFGHLFTHAEGTQRMRRKGQVARTRGS